MRLSGAVSADGRVLLLTRGLRAFADGLVSVVLPVYLLELGYSPLQIGAIATSTLLGSAALTMAVGVRGHRIARRFLLQTVALLMVVTGLAFTGLTAFWALLAVAALGTINPSSGDVSVFLPTEQALLPATAPDDRRTALFARYALVGYAMAAVGSLVAGVPQWVADHTTVGDRTALRLVFVVYSLIGLSVWVNYRRLSTRLEGETAVAGPLGPSRRIVYRLAALFSLDSFGGGFVVQSLLVVWLADRHDLSAGASGLIFFGAGLLSAASTLLAAPLARRIGLVRTMVFTHLPANGFLIAAAFMPNAPLAVAMLFARAMLSQMDVPARTSYVMAVVTPPERAAAASITNVPRSLAAAAAPFAAGWMLDQSSFGWPLVVAGTLKVVYDLALLAMFRHIRPPEEAH